jgi:hypothetical protein
MKEIHRIDSDAKDFAEIAFLFALSDREWRVI